MYNTFYSASWQWIYRPTEELLVSKENICADWLETSVQFNSVEFKVIIEDISFKKIDLVLTF